MLRLGVKCGRLVHGGGCNLGVLKAGFRLETLPRRGFLCSADAAVITGVEVRPRARSCASQ